MNKSKRKKRRFKYEQYNLRAGILMSYLVILFGSELQNQKNSFFVYHFFLKKNTNMVYKVILNNDFNIKFQFVYTKKP